MAALRLAVEGSVKEAAQVWDRAIALAPDNPVLYRHRGEMLGKLGREREAVTVRAGWAGCCVLCSCEVCRAECSVLASGLSHPPAAGAIPCSLPLTQDFTIAMDLPECPPGAFFDCLLGRARCKQSMGGRAGRRATQRGGAGAALASGCCCAVRGLLSSAPRLKVSPTHCVPCRFPRRGSGRGRRGFEGGP